MFDFKNFFAFAERVKGKKDFTTVKVPLEIGEVQIPVIPLVKYPEITRRLGEIIVKVSEDIANQQGKSPEQVLEEFEPKTLLELLPRVLKIAADDFYPLAAFVLEIEEERIKKMGLPQIIQILKATWEHNDFVQVQKDLANFTRPLAAALFKNLPGQGENQEV